MKMRLQYNGGSNQEVRMNVDKLRSLKKALLYSYQAATAVLEDGREFRCLINPDKLKEDYDDKIISIPFRDVCLNQDRVGTTTQGEQEIGLKVGDVFEWKENGTHWITFLQHLEETAYFRASIRKCEYEIEIGGKKYWIYLKGPTEISALWNTKDSIPVSWNDLNYKIIMYAQNKEDIRNYFHRFDKIEINDRPWEVVAIDEVSTAGIITVALKETYRNTIEKLEKAAAETNNGEDLDEDETEQTPHIEGSTIVYPYDHRHYKTVNAIGGQWVIKDKRAFIEKCSETEVDIVIAAGRSGKFKLYYQRPIEDDLELEITIESL